VWRGLQIAYNLELPIALILTGGSPIPEPVARSLRHELLHHRAPVVVVLSGPCAPSHLDWIVGDSVLAADDLAIGPQGGVIYGASELRQSGIVDNPDAVDIEGQISLAIDRARRQSSARRTDSRIQTMMHRGADSVATTDAARRELIDLRELQDNVRRSMDDWRQRLERHEFRRPSLANLPNLPALRQIRVPDRAEVRERLSQTWRGSSDGPGQGVSTSEDPGAE
jgi:hypothetical protein